MRKNHENGALIVEATIVFPVMFLVILFLLVTGNAFYQKCRVDAIITQHTIDGAAYCADPQLKGIEGGTIPDSGSVEVYPYRAFSGSGASEIEAAVGFVQTDVNKLLKGLDTGLFSAMRPQDVKLKLDYDNMVMTSSFSIESSYRIKLPVRLLFAEDFFFFAVNTRVEMPVSNVTEMIRNAEMAEDYMEQYGLKEGYDKIKDKLVGAIEKAHDWFT